jgi:hypothetical protein
METQHKGPLRIFSGLGMVAGYKGSCSVLGRTARALGEDIAKWLAAPSMDALLGDLG